MELIKKKFKQAVTTGTTTGCTGNCYVIIADTGVTYNIGFMLKQTVDDWGYFDTYVFDDLTGTTISAQTNVISGASKSRLFELKKYSRSGTLDKLFYTSTDPATDGVNESLTTTGVTYTYYIGGVTYVDNVTGGTTLFSVISSGYSDTNNFSNYPIVKDENLQNIIDKPLVDNNVFIIREEQRIMDKNYRLRNLRNIKELQYYAGGAFFNIKNNT